MPSHYNTKKNAPMEKFSSSSGGGLSSGLSSQEKVSDSPEDLGMGTKSFAKNQVPVGPDKRKAKGPFTFC